MKAVGFLSLLAIAAAAPITNTAILRERVVDNGLKDAGFETRDIVSNNNVNALHRRGIATGGDFSSNEADILKRRLLDDALETAETGTGGAESNKGGNSLNKRGDDDHVVNVKAKVNALADLLGLLGIKLNSDSKVGALKRGILDLDLDLDDITAIVSGILGLKLGGFVKAGVL